MEYNIEGGTTTTTDYCGNVVYENGTPKYLLTEEGYVTLADKKYHYFLQDHQGNNRVVVDAAGTVEEVNHYYPFGGLFASSSAQPYKYNGKEYDDKKGLNWYDYGARMYDAATGRFTTVDPMAENAYSGSPYAYCLDNPVIYIDPHGKDTIAVSDIDWANFNVKEDVIALDEITINDYNPWQIAERNGIYRLYNIFTGNYGSIVGEQGLHNADHWLFEAITLGRQVFFNSITSTANRTFSQIGIAATLPKSAIEDGVAYVMKNPSKIVHIFGQTRHNLMPLVSKLGNNENVVRSTLQSLVASNKLPTAGIFEQTVKVGGYNVTVRGIVQNGIPKIATMFIP